MLQTLIYSKFAIANIGDADLDATPLEPYPTVPTSQFRWRVLFSEPACQAVVEDWFKGHDIEWTYWIETIFYVLSGECEITHWQPPNWVHKTVVVAKPGDIFLCPRGSRVRYRVVSDEVFRHFCIDIPNAGYDAEELAAGTADRGSSS